MTTKILKNTKTSYFSSFSEKSVPSKNTQLRPKEESTVPLPKTSPKAAATAPGPTVMPGVGQSLGGSVASPTRNVRTQSSLSGQQPSTPDPEEVRRRRLAFLEKQNKKN